MPPTEQTLKDRIDAAIAWVQARVENADQANQKIVKQFPCFPIALNVTNYPDPAARIRHLGTEQPYKEYTGFAGIGYAQSGVYPFGYPFAKIRRPAILTFNLCSYYVDFYESSVVAYTLKLDRTYNSDGTINYTVTLVDRPRPISPSPVELWFGTTRLSTDLNAEAINTSWSYTNSGIRNTPRYFIRGYNLTGARLLQGDDPTNTDIAKIDDFSERFWHDLNFDWPQPYFGLGTGEADDFLWDEKMFQDTKADWGYPGTYPVGLDTNWFGYSHRSKVGLDLKAYLITQTVDPLTLISVAIHLLNKYGDPDKQFYTPRITGWRDRLMDPASVFMESILYRYTDVWTPRKVAKYTKEYFYTQGLGVSMYVPFRTGIVADSLRFASPFLGWLLGLVTPEVYLQGEGGVGTSLRSNGFLALTSLLGYKYNRTEWQSIADDLADVLVETQWGLSPYNQYEGITQDYGTLRRPQFQGAQLIIWKKTNSFMLPTFSLLRRMINELGDLPPEEADALVSNVETTATFAQALRIYLRYKYSTSWPTSTNLP